MNKKKLFGVMASAAMLLNATPLSVFAEEMVEASGVVGAVTNPDGSIAINAQNFPDENLLGAVKTAANGGTDATKITTLSVPSNVENLAGLQYLTGLTSLTVANNNNLSSLDLSTNTALTTLTVDGNKGLVSITLPTTEELGTITITNNNSLTELDLSPASLVTNANLSNNALAKLNVSNNLHLLNLDVHGNVLYALDTTNCRHLTNINAAGNRIYEIDITSRAVINLNLAGNKLTTLDVSEMVNLQKLNVADNMLESIVLPEEETLTYFNCDQNHLASLDLSGVIQGSTPETSGANGVTVITGTQSLFAGTEDKAIDLKAYDANFDPNNTAILDKDGNPTKDKIAKNGIADLAATEVIMPDETPGENPGTNPGTPTTNPVTLTDKNTKIDLTATAESSTTTTVPTVATAQNLQSENVKLIANGPTPFALGVQVLDDNFQPTGEWKYIPLTNDAGTTSYVKVDEENVTETEAKNVDITADGLQELATSLGSNTMYANVNGSVTKGANFTTIQVEQATVLSSATKNVQVLATGASNANSPDLALAIALQGKEADGNWVTITTDAATYGFNTLKGGTISDGAQATYTVESLTPWDTLSNTQKAQLAPFMFDSIKSINIPAVNAYTEATLLTEDNTRVVRQQIPDNTPTSSSDSNLKYKTSYYYIQVKKDGEWITIDKSAALGSLGVDADGDGTPDTNPTDVKGDLFKVIGVTANYQVTLGYETSPVAALAAGYKLGNAAADTLVLPKKDVITSALLQPKNIRVYYVLGEDGKPVVQEVQVNTEDPIATPDPNVDTGWVTLASTADEAYSMFEFGTFTAPTAANTTGTIQITSAKNLPIDYVADLPTGDTLTVAAYPTEGTTTPKYTLTKVTIENDGKTIDITNENDLANFEVNDVTPASEEGASAGSASATLAYADTANVDFQKQYPIDGDSITVEATITSGTATQEMIEVMTEAQATASTTSVLKPAPVALAYAYDTEAEVSGDQMTVKIYKENLMNRLYNPNSGEHFYTKDNHEKDVLVSLGWQYEGIGWVAPNGAPAVAPVYRLYNPNAGDHHYTEDANEKDTLVRVGWSFEGVGWYSAADPVYYSVTGEPSAMTGNNGNRTIDVFREYNPNAKAAGAHNYTISENENAVLVSLGWIDEGIAWNALK